ncbi:hypothetical protein GW17_00041534 [Ensete ventricosum]|nr:hypothetical protein GW17_00041534 [Ensete ventricosum]
MSDPPRHAWRRANRICERDNDEESGPKERAVALCKSTFLHQVGCQVEEERHKRKGMRHSQNPRVPTICAIHINMSEKVGCSVIISELGMRENRYD